MFCVSAGATTSEPPHTPFVQTSPTVQGLPSLHAVPLGAGGFVHAPVRGSQLSVVQTLLSLQTTGMPPWHNPPLQVSPVVQKLLSSHGAVLFVYTQPVCELHASSVHGLLSLQLCGGL